MADYKWKPIEDLPDAWTKLASSELGGLAAVWREHYETIKDSKALKQFNERLRREWAIETGIIENLYYIDRGVTLTLIEKGIEASLIPHGSTDRPAELIVPMLKDHEEVVTGLFDFVGQQRQLSTSYIKQLHQALTQHQRTTAAKDNFGTMIEVELLRGDWKKLPNNPTKSDDSIHEYCPPEQVASEMDRLISLHQEHLEKGVPPEVEAAWLHHRFTQIHPFQDGNGRMARTLASLIFLRAGLFPLVIHRDERDDYIDCLEIADHGYWGVVSRVTRTRGGPGSLRYLVEFFSHAQKKAINQAVNLSDKILHDKEPLDQIISAAIDKIKIKQRPQVAPLILNRKLTEIGKDKFSKIAEKLNNELKALSEEYIAYYRESEPNTASHHNSIISKIAASLGYEASFPSYQSWIAIHIHYDSQWTEIIIAFHSIGDVTAMALAATGFISYSIDSKNGYIKPVSYSSLGNEAFQYSLIEDENEVSKRFLLWSDSILVNGIDHWRQQL